MLTPKMEDQIQDAIVKTPKFMKILKNEEKLKIMRDENLRHVLKFLRKGPMTLNDLISAFKKGENEKSDKTLYRYLNKLKENEFIYQVGCRTSISLGGKPVVEKLYDRTARIFYFVDSKDVCCSNEEKKNNESEKQINLLHSLLKSKYETITKSQVKTIVSSVIQYQEESIKELAKKQEIFNEINNDIGKIELEPIIKILDLFKFISIIPKLVEFESILRKTT